MGNKKGAKVEKLNNRKKENDKKKERDLEEEGARWRDETLSSFTFLQLL